MIAGHRTVPKVAPPAQGSSSNARWWIADARRGSEAGLLPALAHTMKRVDKRQSHKTFALCRALSCRFCLFLPVVFDDDDADFPFPSLSTNTATKGIVPAAGRAPSCFHLLGFDLIRLVGDSLASAAAATGSSLRFPSCCKRAIKRRR